VASETPTLGNGSPLQKGDPFFIQGIVSQKDYSCCLIEASPMQWRWH
jgi:hypothetical protein